MKIALPVAIALTLCTLACLQANTPRLAGPLHQDAYVWQRHWDQSVKNALSEVPEKIRALTVLGGEITWTRAGKNARYWPIKIQSNWLTLSKRPVTVALRVGAYSGSFKRTSEGTKFLLGSLKELMKKTKNKGLRVVGIQIDFDCGSSKLDGYRNWLKLLRNELSSTELSITTLPTWLQERAFGRLVRAVDYYVLQVHSFERPRDSGRSLATCHSNFAVTWAEQAAAFERPFFVALPSYSYIVHFDRTGRFRSLSADGAGRRAPVGGRSRFVRSNSESLAALVRVWTRSRPAHFKGLIWYRLPISRDRMNWPAETFKAVINGCVPKSELILQIKERKSGLWELFLSNKGEREESVFPNVNLTWADGRIVASDLLCGYRWGTRNIQDARLRPGEQVKRDWVLRPGERHLIAWLRMSGGTYVEASFQSNCR
jgi:hypothetical protein